MKKLLCVLFVLILSLPVVAMADVDWSGMSVEEIQMEINKARAEILTREIKTDEKGSVILDSDGLVVSINNIELSKSYDDSYKLTLTFTVVNNSDEDLAFTDDGIYLNGWAISGLFGKSVAAGMKARDEVNFYSVDVKADVSCYEDLEELKFVMHTYDTTTYYTKTPNIECTIYFK